MGTVTGIEWTDATWNPVRGCSRVSEGCRNCYAEGVAARFSGPGQAYEGFADRARTGSKWTGKVALVPSALPLPLSWRTPKRIFVNSMSDLFHEGLTDGEILRVMMVIWQAPRHTFQVLTKRPERMRAWFEAWNDVDEADYEPKLARGPEATRAAHTSGRSRIFASMLDSMGTPPPGAAFPTYDWAGGPRWWSTAPAPNLWLGVSVENQATADERIPHLLAVPAAVRFLSCEPLLGAVDLDVAWHGESALDSECWGDCAWCEKGHPPLRNCQRGRQSEAEFMRIRSGIDWVIAGGESGPGARPMHPEWARSLRDQCAAAGVPFFFKQWGEWRPICQGAADWYEALHCSKVTAKDGQDQAVLDDIYGRRCTVDQLCLCSHGEHVGITDPGAWLQGTDSVLAFRIGKKAAGALLDGREHKAFPA
jgi:protein gp37